jgi:hypothetical protein
MSTLRHQLRNNAVALISLTVALGSLGYNTWRNERTDYNRNIRTATFELLGKLSELERQPHRRCDRRAARVGARDAAVAQVRLVPGPARAPVGVPGPARLERPWLRSGPMRASR